MGHKPIKDPQHGQRRRYQLGCKCGQCVAANAHYQRLYRGRGNRGATRSAVDPATGRIVYYVEAPLPGMPNAS